MISAEINMQFSAKHLNCEYSAIFCMAEPIQFYIIPFCPTGLVQYDPTQKNPAPAKTEAGSV